LKRVQVRGCEDLTVTQITAIELHQICKLLNCCVPLRNYVTGVQPALHFGGAILMKFHSMTPAHEISFDNKISIMHNKQHTQSQMFPSDSQ